MTHNYTLLYFATALGFLGVLFGLAVMFQPTDEREELCLGTMVVCWVIGIVLAVLGV